MATGSFNEIRNVLVIGKIGSGKSTLINNTVRKDLLEARFSFSRVTRQIQQIKGTMEIDKVPYGISFIDTIGLGDAAGAPSSSDNFTNPQVIASINKAIKDRFKDGLNLVIITINVQAYTKDDKEMFKILQSNFKPMFWKSAVLVFTHCDGMIESAVQQRINSFKNDEQTKDIAGKFEDRIETVGFPSLVETSEDIKATIIKDMERDVKKLHERIKNAALINPYQEIVSDSTCCIV